MVKVSLLTSLPLIFLSNYVLAKKNIKIDIKTKKNCARKAQAGDSVMIFFNGTIDNEAKTVLTEMQKMPDNHPAKRPNMPNMPTPPGIPTDYFPMTFKLGHGQVLHGLDQGIQGMCPGERREIWIPSHLAYDERKDDDRGIVNGLNMLAHPKFLESAELKKGDNVIFEILLLSINDKKTGKVHHMHEDIMQSKMREMGQNGAFKLVDKDGKPINEQQQKASDEKFMEDLKKKMMEMKLQDEEMNNDPIGDGEIEDLMKNLNINMDDIRDDLYKEGEIDFIDYEYEDYDDEEGVEDPDYDDEPGMIRDEF